jgi:hypothetical protein
MSYTYQWERCDADGANCSDIGGATAAAYSLVADDVGSTVRVRVSDGTDTVTSGPSPVITAAPVPVPTGNAVDDKRAYQCSEISMTGWSYNNPSPGVHTLAGSFNGNDVVGAHSPYLFSFLDFTNDDVEVLTDGDYGDYWHMKCGPTSHNPFVDHVPTSSFWYYTHNTNLSWSRPMYTDQGDASWDWYAYAIKMDPGWTNLPDGSLFMEVGYPHIASPPLEIGINKSGNIQATRSAGLWAGHYPWPSTEMSPALFSYAATAGKWVEMLVGVYWSSHGAGQIIVKTRCPANGETVFTTRWQKSGIDTWQWSGGVPQDANGYMVDDLFGPYEQWNSSFSTHADNFPQHNYHLAGWVRCISEADARSFLPA